MFTIKLDSTGSVEQIYLSNKTFMQLNIKSDSIILHFGTLTKKLSIQIDDSLDQDEIKIPAKLSQEVSIPALPYDCYFNEDHLFLGPVIGYLAVQKYYSNPALVSRRFANYERIRGLIFLFRPDTIRKNTGTISGKYFDPETKTFVKGIFPYPNAVYNRSPISRRTFLHLKSQIGSKVFNYPFFNTNKWTFWRWMSKVPSIAPHLPETAKYTGLESLLKALEKHSSVYLKPTGLSQGRGILNVAKSGAASYLLSDRYGKKQLCASPKQLAASLQKATVPNRQYIIQQAIPFKTDHGNKIDFRIYIQKNISGEWKFSGMETKVAKKGSIISNSSNRKLIVPGKAALSSYFGLKGDQIQEKTEEITQLCIQVLRVIEKRSHHLGDAALDFVMDKNHKVWLLEVQLNYAADKKARRSLAERQVLPFILPTPFEYAKGLSGF